VRVLVTGASGLVGSHTAAALRARGHEVRALVRDPARLERALAPLGASGVERARGDVTDRRAVERALAGCQAAVHAAGLVSLERRRAAELERTNAGGTRIVLEAALEAGLDPVVHVSSLAALFPPVGPRLGADEPVKEPRDGYARSKAAAERIARRLQEAGAPVVIFHPGGVWGPHHPSLGEGLATVMRFVRLRLIPIAPGGIPVIDARDLAAALAAALRPGAGPRRYLAGGHLLRTSELRDLLTRLTGRRFLGLRVPGAALRAAGRLGDLAARAGWTTGVTREAMAMLTRAVPSDDPKLESELGVALRPVEETLRDMLGWMLDVGLLTPRQGGALAARRA
jgi:nucleoside-diphosphate-sugar epimerase